MTTNVSLNTSNEDNLQMTGHKSD